jgi:hypothetical protein
MISDYESLWLRFAPLGDDARSFERLMDFLERFGDENVLIRAQEVFHKVINDGGVWFLETLDGDIVAITAVYRLGNWPYQWAEIGTTLVAPRYRGAQIQSAIYRHLISLMRLSDWPQKFLFAVANNNAVSSYTNLERLKFERVRHVPGSLFFTNGFHGSWSIETGKRRLYLLSNSGIADALDFVAANGPQHRLTDKEGKPRFWFCVNFAYLQQDGARDALKKMAEEIRRSEEARELIRSLRNKKK